MSATTSLQALREALAGEHAQLESWLRESFAAMDALYGELYEWQRDLTGQQAQLDQREAALSEPAAATGNDSLIIAKFKEALAAAREQVRQLKHENGVLQESLEDLQLHLAGAETPPRDSSRRSPQGTT
jgi:chromosome segregation ATPase